ncbi:prim-pol domain-containing protein [Serendipita vermifera]|nr:prim-pol domain-containing protein [Serendipita vermifera]
MDWKDDSLVPPEVLSAFYDRLYPFRSIYTWLSHTNPTSGPQTGASRFIPAWNNREFAFTLKDDVYLRYNSFQDADEFKKQVLKLLPTRFEIGAIYNAKPRDKKTLASALQPVRRELVFDIDMTDYDAIRTCCSDKNICRQCWQFIAAAVDVLDETLRKDFGYNLLLWVYSGRRGIHCWVSDEAAMNLTDEQRKAIMGWIEVIKGGKEMIKKVNVRMTMGKTGEVSALTHSLARSVETLSMEHFANIVLTDQDCFKSRKGWETLVELIPDREVAAALREKWDDEEDYERQRRRNRSDKTTSACRWEDLKKEIKQVPKASTRRGALTAAMEDIILQYTYPRIDAEVSKHRNHLLKAPFCVHPATGRVCVPVDPKQVAQFEPETVPTVAQLLGELDSSSKSTSEEGAAGGWESTSLKPYVDMLNEHNKKILQAEREKKMHESRNDMSW